MSWPVLGDRGGPVPVVFRSFFRFGIPMSFPSPAVLLALRNTIGRRTILELEIGQSIRTVETKGGQDVPEVVLKFV